MSSTTAVESSVEPSRGTPKRLIEVQALRAVAVALVVVYHLWPSRLTGGYVGVDVFFVISGFLITSHIARQVIERRFSFVEFYARRIRRLLPAAFLVLIACALGTLLWVPEANWSRFLQEIGASAVYVENWLLANNAVDYLASTNPASPVQHFWSLSVEEQFYIVWPLLLVGAAVVAGHYVKRSGARRGVGFAIATATGLVFVASLAFSISFTHTNPSAAYFITPTRAWEFAAGGLLAALVSSKGWRRIAGRVPSTIIGLAGIALIAVSAVTFTEATAFPGWIGIVPVGGAALVIAASQGRDGALRRWSSAAPIQFVGNISYSIYLWHLALIVFWPYVTGQAPNFLDDLALLAATLLLASATWLWVERPFQRAKAWSAPRSWKPFAFAAVGAAVIIALCLAGNSITTGHKRAVALELHSLESANCFGAAAMVASNNCADPFAVTDTASPTFASTDVGVGVEISRCEAGNSAKLQAPCVFGKLTEPTNTVALFGDSHAGQLIDALAPAAARDGWKLETWVHAACAGVGVRDGSICEAWSAAALQQIEEDPTIDTVIVANATSKYRGTSQLVEAGVAADLRALQNAGKKTIVVRDPPGSIRVGDVVEAKDNVNTCLGVSRLTNDPCTEPRSRLVTSDTMIVAAGDVPGVSVIDLTPYFCDDSVCHSVIGGLDVYSDGGHLSKSFALSLSPFIGALLRNDLPPTAQAAK